MNQNDIRYLTVLKQQYPTIASAATEIINLKAIMSLPKGTEHFITDVHGEYDQFLHVLKNGSGAIRRKIDEIMGPAARISDKKAIATLIYYPSEKLAEVSENEEDMDEWYRVTIYILVRIAIAAASKYTRSKVRKAMSPDFAYIMEELMTGRPDESDQEAYYTEIILSVIETKRAGELIIALCNLIRRLVVDHLHVVGDIFNRGPFPHLILDTLMHYHSVDIEWGNHDVVWMGAAAGSAVCMANVLRVSARYGNLDTIEDGYGINLVPLAKLALEKYADDPCRAFKVNYMNDDYEEHDASLEKKMHKAIAIIQFKLEGQTIRRQPDFHMEDRLLLEKIDYEHGTINLDGKTDPLTDTFFPTIDPKDPYRLSPEEEDTVRRLVRSFRGSEKLQTHVRFLYTKGSIYKTYNGNLLYHGCVPMNEDGSFRSVRLFGKDYAGRSLYDVIESYARKGYYSEDEEERKTGQDMLWFAWSHKDSPVYGRDKMTTFERYFIEDRETHIEKKDPYYTLLDKKETAETILKEFGLHNEDAHIINGHVPVEAKAGESPIKCGGKLLIIDGGFSKAYQPMTGIAGYTLIYDSYGLMLAAHEPFESVEKAVREGSDVHSDIVQISHSPIRKTVADTDNGRILDMQVADLENLLNAYRNGSLVEGK